MGALYNVTGSGECKMAASIYEVLISKVAVKMKIKFRRLRSCYQMGLMGALCDLAGSKLAQV